MGMTITKKEIEECIYKYNEAIKKLEDAGINHDNYTVTITHTSWIKLLIILKTHIEAWDKVKAEIEEHVKINQNLDTDRARALCWCLDVINKYRAESEDKE